MSLSLFFLLSCTKEPADNTIIDPEIETNIILTGYQIIWGMDFLPDGDLIFTEKSGKIYRKSGDNITEITGFPAVLPSGQGGLLDICVHPDYSSNGWVYASYSATNPEGGAQLKLIRFRITGNQIRDIENIFSTNGSNTWFGHYGSRIVFDRDKYLFMSVGEGGSNSYGGPDASNKNAQDPKSSWGKIHRLKEDGTIPADNPLIPGNTGPSSIYSYGHRNPQGLILNPETGDIWETEHGPRGGDEVNIILKGANYGWPFYSIGVNYDGTQISSGHNAVGITPPLYTWTPSIGICGMAFITSDRFKSWKGNLLVSGLASHDLYRCTVSGNKITQEVPLLTDIGRVRDVAQAPDGSIFVSVENPGRIIRILPK
ncbi:MAG: PQQ-dependent sugar dehydrogenase [Bacteroidales bacterium]|nr:PQQ-dependent sugar dehydrogenase [Bacteroidales bacterium]